MSYLYVTEQGARINCVDERMVVSFKDVTRSVPIETLEEIEVFGNIQLTTQCMEQCLKRGINVVFFSSYGSYFGRLISTNHVNVERQRRQADLGHDDEFNLSLAKIIISAKIANQITVVRRYARSRGKDESKTVSDMAYCKDGLGTAKSVEEIMGYEGSAAKSYFGALGRLVEKEFAFKRRSRRPPLDPFNSMLSLGYSILLNEVYGKIESKGLNPYFGILHKDREKHPTLASDLMEEWRAVLVDTLVMGMVNGYEITTENFYRDPDGPAILMEKDGFRKFVKKLEDRFMSSMNYLSYVDYSTPFRRAIALQVGQFAKAIENGDPDEYHPVLIR